MCPARSVQQVQEPSAQDRFLTLHLITEDLADQREVLEGVSENASRIARERHDSETIINKMLDVYKEVLTVYEK